MRARLDHEERTTSENVAVELDIFSGNPNPTWTLSSSDAALFLQKTAALPRVPPRRRSTNLGYRFFIVRVMQGKETSVRLVQNGIVELSRGGTTLFGRDHRSLERGLLQSGRPVLKNDLASLVERELTN